MKRDKWQIFLGLSLVTLSAIFYILHYVLYHDLDHILLWGITNLAFLPISVLFVTLIINELMSKREKSIMLEKLNMLIGTFFSQVGTKMLIHFSDWDPQLDSIKNHFVVSSDWSKQEFLSLKKRLIGYHYRIDIFKVNLSDLKTFLTQKIEFMLRLLENPTILEHTHFTELLRAVFHLTEELSHRMDINNLPGTDLDHIKGDIERVYGLLVTQWLDYMKYLQGNYPYLFSLAMRTNPFDQNASPVVK